MKCPYCGDLNNEVIETRDSEDLVSIRRRRECMKCHKRFTTYERPENIELIVIKKDNRREKFEREKIRHGILKACEKRPVSMELINQIVDEAEMEIRNKGDVEVSSKLIGKLVLSRLKKIDKVAYLRFASVYLDFADLSDFEKTIEKIS